ncbi:hypothetical protein Skr01_24310 [Sphaerisporangium krabiense]|uniref:CHAT domain-containing protein n=1 Tax=Sphaerisporangium krabiense TaxID=763782 RepID=A0A7W9DR50_9ACTN|nr:CHAT domain-containing protein [Sphaerisporangium krabiense]MBB5628176.1 hypothetical protein [Sphaerisporangium krabiense]GII62346.1 hypothetical protein Skr01_24310 [Sphaerisporangium krabiense]
MTAEGRRRFFGAVFGSSRRTSAGPAAPAPAAPTPPPGPPAPSPAPHPVPPAGSGPETAGTLPRTRGAEAGDAGEARARVVADAGDPMVFDVIEADLGAGLPEGMALLTVVPVPQEGGAPGFRLRGVCCCGEAAEFAEVYGRPRLDLGELASEGGELPADVLSFMQIWSRPKAELTRWLDRRICAHGERLQLVIWDDTGYRIPWELFWLDYDGGRSEGWLGGVVTLTRWLSIRTPWPETVRDYRSAHTCTGPVAAYVEPRMPQDHALLTSYHVERSADMPALAKALRAHGTALALIYVACHGRFGDQVTESALGGLPLKHADTMKFLRLRSAATLVFLNACQSGALGYDTDRFNDRVLRGFAEVFLRSGAAGVLATSGNVGDREAWKMARELFRYMREHPGRPVAEALRELRARAATLSPADLAGVSGRAADEELIPLLYRFMYVYYGSPRTLVTPDAALGAS